jgi:two-component system chemotaxis response regulator CheB
MPEWIRVVVADDSPFICRLLKHYLESDPSITVVKTAFNGRDAVDSVKAVRPDVVTLDLDMPVMSGIDALRQIMVECPTAVVLISGLGKQAAQMTTRGLSLGAVDFILKYSPGVTIPADSINREIVAKVKAAAQVKVIRSIPSMEARFNGFSKPLILEPPKTELLLERGERRLVIVGASTGGPLALKDLLASLRNDFSFALIVVQHMPEGFTATLAAQFNRLFSFSVREASQGEFLSPGSVLVTPGDRHLLVRPDGSLLISLAAKINGSRPSIDATMQSAAQVFGSDVTGVILSGMGMDGTEGLLSIRRNGGTVYAQSKETCVIDTMPKTAIRKGIVHRVGSPKEIGRWLC